MTEPTNAHQPTTETNKIVCAAPGCGYSMHTYNRPDGRDVDWAHHFRRQHTDQYEPGRAPDIAIDYAIEASCSVCTDKIGNVQMCDDGDAVCCKDCGTHWDMNGGQGQLEEEEEPDLEPEDEPEATGGLLDAFVCQDCDYGAGSIKEAMAHAGETAHVLTATNPPEGTTITISIADDEDDDEDEEWDEGWGDD